MFVKLYSRVFDKHCQTEPGGRLLDSSVIRYIIHDFSVLAV